MPVGSRILLVEDEPSIAEPLVRLLEREGFVAVVAATAHDALEHFSRERPDLVLLDLTLPDGDGRDVCRTMRSRADVPIIMVTARGTEIDRIVGLELGADDYVVKPFSSGEIVARIRAVLRRARSADRPVRAPVQVGSIALDPAARQVTVEGQPVDLTRKEFDLLTELMAHAETVVTREDLMARVWDENWFGSTKTLDVHIAALRRKLGDDGAAPRLIHTVRGVGFRVAGDGQSAARAEPSV